MVAILSRVGVVFADCRRRSIEEESFDYIAVECRLRVMHPVILSEAKNLFLRRRSFGRLGSSRMTVLLWPGKYASLDGDGSGARRWVVWGLAGNNSGWCCLAQQ
jgi:hypothetical protein